jgi:hypothetical protein
MVRSTLSLIRRYRGCPPMSSAFRLDFITHDDYEFLAVEIGFQGQRLCQLFRRKNDDLIEIEFVDDPLILNPPVRLKFAFDDFLEVLDRARKELLALKL